nr:PQQ-binding-like beta-propeller repeat protein [candidate division Zixibacteria bacterium]
MSYKLIIAVLTLGLLLAFSSAVLGSDVGTKHGLNPYERFNQDAPRTHDMTAIEREAPAFQKPATGIMELATPATVLPPQYFCEFIDYSGGAASYYWRIPDSYNDSEMGMRFTPSEGYTCTLLTAYIGVYGSYLGGSAGTPDMKVTVYTDDGFGYPGTALGSVVVPFANLPTSGMAYVPADLSSLGPLVFTDGEEFHVGVSVDNFVDGDTLAILSDDGSAGLLRSWENWNGLYGLMNDDWGIDINFLIGVDLCCGLIPYTDCYTQDYTCGTAYYWTNPDAYGDDYFNMRFSVDGPETLMEVGVALYAAPTVGTPDLDVYVWGGDGSGFPDLTNEIAKVTIPYASLVFYPSYNVVDLSALNLIMTEDFFVGWSVDDVSGGTLAGLSDDGSCGVGRSSEYWGSWGTMLDDWGADVNFLIYADLCRDEFSQCKWLYDYCNLAYFWRLPDAYGDVGNYQKFNPSGLGCRLEYFDMALYWPGSEAALPLYTYNSDIQIWSTDAVTGLPDVLLESFTLTPADYVLYPGVQAIDFSTALPDPFLFDQPIWIGIESYAPTADEGIRTLSDDGSCAGLNSAEMWYSGTDRVFSFMGNDWSVDPNFIMEAYVCCVPLPERVCVPGEDWPTMAKSFAHTNASLSSLGTDVQGNLTKAWEYQASQVSNLNSPVIYNDTIVCYFLNNLAAIDLNTGTQIWQYNADGFVIGGGCYASPTIYNFDAYGDARTLVFTPGGDAKAFSAINLATGAVVWTKNFMQHNSHFMTWGVSVIVDIGGVPVVIYNDDDGDIYAREALTGNDFTGWVTSGAGNPINVGGGIYKGLTTDGEYLYIGTADNISNGDIYCVDATTGLLVWQFADQQLCNLDAGNCGTEAFTGGIAYDLFDGVPTLFAASSYDQYTTYPPYMSGGIIYRINAADGSLVWAHTCNAQDYNGPALDGGHVIQTGWNGWVSSGEFRGPVAFNKNNGTVKWSMTTTNPSLGSQWMADGILSCETEKFDWYMVGNNSDFFDFYNSDNGEHMFHRRYARGIEYAHHYSPAMTDGHLLVCHYNELYCLTEQAPRPRLDIPIYGYDVPVEFGLPDGYTVVWENALGNTGGAPLTIDSVKLIDTDNGTTPANASISVVNFDLIENSERLAEKFAGSADMFRASITEDMARTVDVNDVTRNAKNNAAYVVPTWVYQSTLTPIPGTVIPPQASYNDSSAYINITVQVNAPLIPRGFHSFYARVYTDDPDYFLDSALIDGGAYAIPQVRLGIIGGCLYSSVEVAFGVGEANYTTVWNSTKLGEEGTTEIDGDDVAFFQGALVWAAQQIGTRPPGKGTQFSARVALHCANWHSDDNNWQSILGEVNCYDGTCPPAHLSDILVGSISNDFGANYEDVYGEMAAFAFVDSVADMCDYDTLGNCLSWDWLYMIASHYGVQPPLSDTLTIGFHGCATVISAYDQAALNNFVVYKFDMQGRYAALNNIYVGAMMDYDINYPSDSKNQYCGYDAAHSLGFSYTANLNDIGWGVVRIPFGCGYDQLRGAKTISAGQANWNDTDIWLDSVYYWMANHTGLTHQQGADPAQGQTDPDDRGAFYNIAQLNMPADPAVVTFGFALFGLEGLADASDPASYFELANTANKWCGFGRGDVNNDGAINLVDIAYLIDYVYYGGNGPFPFEHLGDVNADGAIDGADVTFMIDYYFNFGPCIMGEWMF